MDNQQSQLIDVYRIQDPVNAMRTDMDPIALQELAQSIKENGLLQPIVVRLKGDHYEVIAGHRRLSAVRLLKLDQISAVVRSADDRQAIIYRTHENLVREDVDPVSEARFIAQAITELGVSVRDFADQIGRSENYVQDRLDIAAMPDYMQQGLKDKTLKLGVALWLFRIDDERTRLNWTTNAIESGMSVSAAKNAFHVYERDFKKVIADGDAVAISAIPLQMPTITYQCAACRGVMQDDEWTLVRIHSQGCPQPTE